MFALLHERDLRLRLGSADTKSQQAREVACCVLYVERRGGLMLLPIQPRHTDNIHTVSDTSFKKNYSHALYPY